MKTILLSFLFVSISSIFWGQSDLTPYQGNWKMTPSNPSHKYSGLNMTINGPILTIKLKKSPFKSFSARINPTTNRLETYMDQTGYYFVQNSNNSLSLYEIMTNNKIGDYVK